MRFHIFLFILVVLFTLAGLSELAFAEDVYNFQFQKKSDAASQSRPTAVPVPPSPSPSANPAEPVDRVGWFAGLGFGDRAQTNGFDIRNGFSVTGGYRFSKYLGAEADLMFGKGLIDNDSHILVSGGGRITPIHIRVFDWDLIDMSVLVGALTGMKDSDHSKPRLALYVGYGIALNVSDRFLFAVDVKAENADTDLFRITYSAIYRF